MTTIFRLQQSYSICANGDNALHIVDLLRIIISDDANIGNNHSERIDEYVYLVHIIKITRRIRLAWSYPEKQQDPNSFKNQAV